jgi:hypothetical protein
MSISETHRIGIAMPTTAVYPSINSASKHLVYVQPVLKSINEITEYTAGFALPEAIPLISHLNSRSNYSELTDHLN